MAKGGKGKGSGEGGGTSKESDVPKSKMDPLVKAGVIAAVPTGLGATATAGALVANAMSGGAVRETAVDAGVEIGRGIGEAGAQTASWVGSEGLAFGVFQFGRWLSQISASMGFNVDLGIGLQNFGLQMAEEKGMIRTKDIFGNAVITEDKNASAETSDTEAETSEAEKPEEDQVVTTSEADVSAETPVVTAETPAVNTTEVQAFPNLNEQPLAVKMDRVNTVANTLVGENGNIQASCGELKTLFASIMDPNAKRAMAEIDPNITPAAKKCGIEWTPA